MIRPYQIVVVATPSLICEDFNIQNTVQHLSRNGIEVFDVVAIHIFFPTK